MKSIAVKQKAAIVIDSKDNVAVALSDLIKEDICSVRIGENVIKIEVLEDIPFGHKIAVKDLDADEQVLKYGEEIGRMNSPLKRGGWVHSHNMFCERGKKSG
ncbi:MULTISPECIES: UxaA family hydrolase [unclassified Cytobacillus]|uniref:UxaA family hydrolase n=1 Tax=unclassified Cytobacillus TaxID=2675268 RepID=UPI00203C1BBF|nr:UxaA family hydrolase [Cytobacillus sp. AMY 15.2]MCM3093256.1 UxaA family hydrolase [Cytobacillus sp. AMY 15.2]